MRAALVSRGIIRPPIQDLLAGPADSRLERQMVYAAPQRFVSEIIGGWSIQPASPLSRYAVDRFKGDSTWFGPSWIVDGTAVLKVITSGRENMVLWSVDYDHTTDSITLVCGGESASFHDVSDAASPIQCRMSEAERKIMLIARTDVRLGSYTLVRGSNLSIAG